MGRLTVHHLGISQSDRIVWLCEELGLDYELKRYERDAQTRMAPPEYRALHPFGTAPVITDGELVLGESGAIIEYLIARYGGGRLSVSPESPEFPDYLFWFHFANASMMPSAMVDLIVAMLGADPDNAVAETLRDRLRRAYAAVEERLGNVDYFAGGSFSAADIMMMFPLTTMRVFAPHDLSPFPNIRAYLQRIGTRPAYQRAISKADPGFTPPLS